jgi:SAM-dependent methyltransferase
MPRTRGHAYIERMMIEVHGPAAAQLRGFYASPGGDVAARLLRERLRRLWPRLPGLSVMGLGHAAPYLDLWLGEARRCVAVTPVHDGAPLDRPPSWPPPPAGSQTLIAEEESLPFADRSFDRLLLVHGLEAAEHARRLLREAWRVLADDGRLIAVVPNRTGLWAHLDRTPFGHGQPYSGGQLERLLARQMFRPLRRESALFVPPYGLRFLHPMARPWEATGRALFPALAGVVLLEAEKDLFAAAPAGAVAVRRRVVVALPGSG